MRRPIRPAVRLKRRLTGTRESYRVLPCVRGVANGPRTRAAGTRSCASSTCSTPCTRCAPVLSPISILCLLFSFQSLFTFSADSRRNCLRRESCSSKTTSVVVGLLNAACTSATLPDHVRIFAGSGSHVFLEGPARPHSRGRLCRTSLPISRRDSSADRGVRCPCSSATRYALALAPALYLCCRAASYELFSLAVSLRFSCCLVFTVFPDRFRDASLLRRCHPIVAPRANLSCVSSATVASTFSPSQPPQPSQSFLDTLVRESHREADLGPPPALRRIRQAL